MRKASEALISFLNSTQQFIMADLFTIRMNSGVIIRYTSADMDLLVNDEWYSSFLISRSRIKMSVGLEVDTLDVTVNPAPTDQLNGLPWLTTLRQGALDAASLTLSRVFMPTWGDTSLGTLLLFAGRVSDVEIGRTSAKLSVKSELELLDTQLPRNFFQSGCMNTLFDNACGLDKFRFAANAQVISGTTTEMATTLTQTDDTFTLGTVNFTSGANAGVSRSVRKYAGGKLSFALPLLAPVQQGDSFIAYPGCDKTKATCEGPRFNNVIHFKGFPFVPDPETAT